MTLDEAIKHAQWVADTNCDQCAEAHRQLAEWLKELKELRKHGWHPASELPPVNELGESETLIVYDYNNYAFPAFYTINKGWCDEDGRYNLEIRRWCYPPKD